MIANLMRALLKLGAYLFVVLGLMEVIALIGFQLNATSALGQPITLHYVSGCGFIVAGALLIWLVNRK